MNGTDQCLVERMLNDEEAAFAEIYRQHQQNLYRFALHMSGSRVAAEDVTQEVFLALIARGQEYRPERGTLSAFLFGIARNQVLRWLRVNRKTVAMDAACDAVHPRPDPLKALTRRENVDSIRRMILSLPPKYREAVVLCDLHEMDYDSAATILGCSTGTVRSRLHRGRTLLEGKLRGCRATAGHTRGGASYEIPAL